MDKGRSISMDWRMPIITVSDEGTVQCEYIHLYEETREGDKNVGVKRDGEQLRSMKKDYFAECENFAVRPRPDRNRSSLHSLQDQRGDTCLD